MSEDGDLDVPEAPATVEPPHRPAPVRRDDSEKGLGLEMARLFGISPKLMTAPKRPAAGSERQEADLVTEGDAPSDGNGGVGAETGG
jgi:hypothetical protein